MGKFSHLGQMVVMPSVGRRRLAGGGNGGATQWRKELTVESTQVSADEIGFPILLSLASDADLAARAGKSDIYVTESDGSTTVPHEIETFDPATGELVLWFKGDISSSVDTTFYLYYGDATPAPGEDASNVWDSNFKAVWHMAEQDTDAFATNGISHPIYPGLINPAAYYYNGRTYIVWQGDSGLDPYITYYDHSGGTWATPVKVGTNPLSGDDHGVPAVIVDDSGFIHVFFGSHISAQKYSVSTNAEDISTWTAQSDIDSTATYPNVIKDGNGTLHLIHRISGSHTVHRSSADSFATRTTLISPLAADDAQYLSNAIYDAANDRIYVAWADYLNGAVGRFDVYAAYLDLSDMNMYTVDGTSQGAAITTSGEYDAVRVVDSGSFETNAPYLQLDGSGNPHLIYPIDTASGWQHQHVYWDGSAWSTPENITAAGHQFNYSAFYFNGTDIEAYLVTNAASGRAGDLEHWRWNTTTWSSIGTVYDQSAAGGYDGANHPHTVVNGQNALKIVFPDTDADVYDHTDLAIYAVDSSDAYVTAGVTVLDASDSTANDKDGVPSSVTIETGQIAKSAGFNGSNGWVDIPNDILSAASPFTIEGWFYPDGENSTESFDIQLVVDLRGQYHATLEWHEADAGSNPSTFAAYCFDGNEVRVHGAAAEDSWYRVVYTHDGTNMRLYINGSLVGGPTAQGAPSSQTGDSKLGKDTAATNRLWFFGKEDEVRISSVARDSDYVTTTYNNENAPGTFITVGAEEEV